MVHYVVKSPVLPQGWVKIRIMIFFTPIFALFVCAHAQSSAGLWTWRDNDIPGPRTQQSMTPSACNNGGRSGPHAFACPHQMMLSDDMRAAAARDGLNQTFAYALAGCATDAECGACYQVRVKKAEKVWRRNFPMLIVQCINSGFDVMAGQMDLYMGAGGFGYFTSLNSDCRTRACNGGVCRDNLYNGNFAAWTDAEFPDRNKCYSGGIKQFDNATLLREKCRRLSGGSTQRKDTILFHSCVRTNMAYMHQNFYGSEYERVQCPDSLVRISGLQRADDGDYPRVSRGLRLTNTCEGSIESGHACLTTMHDGCVASCSWPGKVDTTTGYPSVTRCNKNGDILG